MGFPYNRLVAPAVLFLNPGITREEYIELLDKTHSTWMREYEIEEPWSFFDQEVDDPKFHGGLEGLAGILRLPITEKFEEFQTETQDENGLYISPPRLWHAAQGEDHKYAVVIHEHNIIEKPEKRSEISWDKLNIGDIWEEAHMSLEKGIVTKIFKEKFIDDIVDENKDEDSYDGPSGGPQYEYKFEMKPFYGKYREEKFKSDEELYSKWPQFHPDFIYDWSKEKGNFSGDNGVNNFFWMKSKDKYSLDPKTFDSIPASSGARMYMGYTDLILTAEAIKHEAWKVLSYRGFIYLDWFLKDFSKAKTMYDRAVWDAHTSLFAKSKEMTITELLRLRNQGS
jgi:hypothetical protein